MAFFAFLFGTFCGLAAALAGWALFGLGLWAGIGLFFATCYGVAAIPFLTGAIRRHRHPATLTSP